VSDAPERIWAYNEWPTGYHFTALGKLPEFSCVEYIRADLHDARIAELEAEVAEQARLNGKGAERELALMAEVARKDEALRLLEYWLDTDAEILDAMPADERASHLQMLGIARAALSPKE
jgi:hypothetical protein